MYFFFEDDGSNKLIELLQEMESVVSPSAKDDVEGLIDVTKNIQKSAQEDDLKAAIEALKTGEKYVKQLLKHLDDDSDFHDVYEEVLKENQDLNQKLNENEAGFNDITKFVNNINDRLEPVLKKSKSN